MCLLCVHVEVWSSCVCSTTKVATNTRLTTPLTKLRYFGIMSSKLSVMNTRLTYSFILSDGLA